METMASDSSPLFQDLLNRGLINETSFSYEYFEGSGYATVMFGGESRDPQAVAEAIVAETERLKRTGIDPAAFTRAKKAIYGENIAALNSTSNIANALASFTFKGRELFAYLDALAELQLSDIQQILERVFDESKTVLSVILPL